MRRKVLLKGDVILEVEQETSGDRGADVANLIGGIANSLEGISSLARANMVVERR